MSRSHPATPRADVYSRITTEIVSAIEAGAGDWRMPWHHDGAATTRPQNVTSRRRYRGVNVLALWIAAEASSYSSGLWGTYRQWAALGGQVRKGERGTTVVFWKQAASRADDDHDDGEAGPGRMFARAFTVFNLAQVEGYEPAPVAVLPESERFEHAEAFVAALKIPITEGAYDAHYRIDLDHIFMPTFASFRDASAQMGTLLHEAAHATGAKHPLDRNFAPCCSHCNSTWYSSVFLFSRCPPPWARTFRCRSVPAARNKTTPVAPARACSETPRQKHAAAW